MKRVPHRDLLESARFPLFLVGNWPLPPAGQTRLRQEVHGGVPGLSGESSLLEGLPPPVFKKEHWG